MIPEKDILDAIDEISGLPDTFSKAHKLSVFYTLLDHLHPQDPGYSNDTGPDSIIGDYGRSDFLKAVAGRDSVVIWDILDELMETLLIIHPRLYNGVMRRIEEGR